jgi:hypothetical protein
MVDVNELWFMVMIMLSNMLLYSEVILMCTFFHVFKTYFCYGYTLQSSLMLSISALEWLVRTDGCCVLGIAGLPIVQGVRLVLCFNQLSIE